MIYSLSKYILSIVLPEDFAQNVGLENDKTINIGGEGSYLDSISFEYEKDMFSTKADTTGSWVHDKTLAANGTVKISLHQLSPQIDKFKKIVNLYRQSGVNYDGLQIGLKDSESNEIMSAQDCFFTQIPTQSFKSESETQEWSLTCGKITTI